jgi:hypothetical protein
MKKIILISLFIVLCLCSTSVSADTVIINTSLIESNPIPPPIYEPWNDPSIGSWFNVTTGMFDPVVFFESAVSPYTDYLGSFFYLILYGSFCLLVYMRSRGIELLTVSIGVTFGVWAVVMPPETLYLFLICIAIGITAIFFRLLKKR